MRLNHIQQGKSSSAVAHLSMAVGGITTCRARQNNERRTAQNRLRQVVVGVVVGVGVGVAVGVAVAVVVAVAVAVGVVVGVGVAVAVAVGVIL